MTINEPKELTPIYLSASRLDKVFDLVSNRNFPTITAETFEGYDFSPSDARLTINALRFLNLIDNDGVPTENMQKLRLRGDARKKEFEKIVRVAYKKLFDVVDAPQGLSNEELANEFVVQYGLSKRIIISAVPAFKKLCEYAGLREEKPPRKTSSSEKPKKPQVPIQKQDKKGKIVPPETKRDFDFHIPIVEEKMYIEIPDEVHQRSYLDDELNNDLRTLIKKAHEFAKKHIPKNEPQISKEDGGD